MRVITKAALLFVVAAIVVVIMLAVTIRDAQATKPMPPPPVEQKQSQKQGQGQEQQVVVNIGGEDGAGALVNEAPTTLTTGSTTLEGGDTTFNSTNESSNVVLVPNNNTENCLRIWGISFGTSSASGGIGYPHRSAACDYEQAADDAAAVGDQNLAWYWRCHKRNIRKPFKGKGVSSAQATEACHAKMTQFMDVGTLAMRNSELERRVQILLDEREFDRDRCNEAKDRIMEGCMK